MDEQALNEKYPGRTVYREGDRIVVNIPVRFRRRNGRQLVFAAGGDGAEGNSKSDDNALVVAIARAWQWQEELESGEYSTVEDLASAKKLDRTYVSRILQLTSLAPDIVESLLAGDDCKGLSLRQLRKGIPALWSEQRKLWGN
jgi:hypothetical protein